MVDEEKGTGGIAEPRIRSETNKIETEELKEAE